MTSCKLLDARDDDKIVCILNPPAFSSVCFTQTMLVQAPLSMGFSRQEFWSGLPFPSPGDLQDSGIEPGCRSNVAGKFFTMWTTREAPNREWTNTWPSEYTEKRPGSESPWFKSQLWFFLAMWPWPRHLTHWAFHHPLSPILFADWLILPSVSQYQLSWVTANAKNWLPCLVLL